MTSRRIPTTLSDKVLILKSIWGINIVSVIGLLAATLLFSASNDNSSFEVVFIYGLLLFLLMFYNLRKYKDYQSTEKQEITGILRRKSAYYSMFFWSKQYQFTIDSQKILVPKKFYTLFSEGDTIVLEHSLVFKQVLDVRLA